MKIVYSLSGNQWNEYSDFLKDLIGKYDARSICDVGGGANPILDLGFVNSSGLEYTVLDISKSQLEKAPPAYHKKVQDMAAQDFPLRDCFDLVFSKALAEHIKNGKVFHRNVFQMLKPGGIAIHYFPTLYALPFVVNKMIPESFSAVLLKIFAPRERLKRAKFPAYYDWCFGPTPSMLNMLQSIGFEILQFEALIGNGYYGRIPILRDLYKKYSEFLVRHPNPYLTSFAKVILRKGS